MAVPTIVSVSPPSGPAGGGQLVEISGTNFRVPTMLYDVPQPDLTPTVAVTVNGVAAARVEVISSTLVRILTPVYVVDPRTYPYPAVSIVLSNVGLDGTVVPGETVTKTSAYTYIRPVLGAPRKDPPLLKVMLALVKALATQVEKNTFVGTHVDYGEEGTGLVIDLARLPAMALRMDAPRDLEYSEGDQYPYEVENLDGTASVYEGLRTHMLVVDITAAAEGMREALFLTQGVEDFVAENPELVVESDQDLFPGQTERYAVEISRDPSQVGGPNMSGVSMYDMQIRVRGITVAPDEATEVLKKIATFTMTWTDMQGDGATDISF